MSTEAPIVGLVCALLVPFLGIQGWVVRPEGLGRHQRNLSVAIYILLAITVGTAVATGTNLISRERPRDDQVVKLGVGTVVITVASGALSACMLASIVLAVVLVVRANDKPTAAHTVVSTAT